MRYTGVDTHRSFDPEHPGAVGHSLRRIIFDQSRSEFQRAVDLLALSKQCPARSLTPQNLAQIFLALGHLADHEPTVAHMLSESEPRKELARLISIGQRQRDGFEPRNIAETLRGLAFLGRGDETFTHALLARATGLVDEFEPADLVTTLGAVRILPLDRVHFLEAANRVLRVADPDTQFNDLEVVLGALYLTDLRQVDSAHLFVDSAMRRLDTLESRHIGILGAALTKLPEASDYYALAVADELERRVVGEPEAVPAREVIQVVELLGRRGAYHRGFLEAFCREYADRLHQLSDDELCETARGLALLGEAQPSFFRRLADEALIRLGGLEPAHFAVIAWSFASLGIRNDTMFNRFAGAMQGRYGEFSQAAAVNFAWSFAPLDNAVARSVISQAARRFRSEETEVLLARQLHIAELAVGIVKPGQCSPEIIEQAQAEIGAGVMNGFEQGVLESLQRLKVLGLAVKPFQVVEGLVPDFVVSHAGRKIVVECDGTQFHLNSVGDLRGNDKIQDQVFRRCGYEVVHIRSDDWLSLSLAEREPYLAARLNLPIGRL